MDPIVIPPWSPPVITGKPLMTYIYDEFEPLQLDIVEVAVLLIGLAAVAMVGRWVISTFF